MQDPDGRPQVGPGADPPGEGRKHQALTTQQRDAAGAESTHRPTSCLGDQPREIASLHGQLVQAHRRTFI